MSMDNIDELYQQVILEHNKKPQNFRKIENASNHAEGYNPLCGDHLQVYLNVDDHNIIQDITFEGDGCAISKASASMMTSSLKGKSVDEAKELFKEFHQLVVGELDPQKDTHVLGKLKIFAGIWHFPARVKCASLCWHTMNGALENKESITTE